MQQGKSVQLAACTDLLSFFRKKSYNKERLLKEMGWIA